MIIETIQNLVLPPIATRGCAAHLASSARVAGGGGNAGIWIRLKKYLIDASRRHRRLDCERQAIAHLQRMTDNELRDIGIRRADIEHAVRYGRDRLQA